MKAFEILVWGLVFSLMTLGTVEVFTQLTHMSQQLERNK